jgi:hypothetical protein
MKNPWTKKNPLMSVWLSSAHSMLNTARGHATAQARREASTLMARGMQDAADFWASLLTPPTARKRKRAGRRPR